MDETNEYPLMLVVLNITIYVASSIVIQTYLASLLLHVMSWVGKLTKINRSTKTSETFALAKRCLGLYTGLEE